MRKEKLAANIAAPYFDFSRFSTVTCKDFAKPGSVATKRGARIVLLHSVGSGQSRTSGKIDLKVASLLISTIPAFRTNSKGIRTMARYTTEWLQTCLRDRLVMRNHKNPELRRRNRLGAKHYIAELRGRKKAASAYLDY